MRTLVVTIGFAVAVFASGATSAKAPAGQGRACDGKRACDAWLSCVAHRDGKPTCELVCAANAKCPEDQRCVKDGAQSVCRPINDGLAL